MIKNTSKISEFNHFTNLAKEWWDPYGKFKPLHKFNPIRISYIKNHIINTFKIKNGVENAFENTESR